MTDMQAFYEKTGGFIKGICHPKDCIGLLPGAGLGWVRTDVPFPYEQDGSLSRSYQEFRAEAQARYARGIRTVVVSPYPTKYLRFGVDVTTPEGLARVEEICAFMAADFAPFKPCWQATNEMHVGHFRAPLSITQARDFIVACIKGLKKGDPAAAVGHNSVAGEEWIELAVEIDRLCGGTDYIGVDLYDGTWSKGGPDTYIPYIDKVHSRLDRPVVLMEFGFASLGGYMEEDMSDVMGFLRQAGIGSVEEALTDIDRLIPYLPKEKMRRTAMEAKPEERAMTVLPFFPHIMKKWPVRNAIPHTEEGQAEFYAQLLPKLMAYPYLGGAVLYCMKDSYDCFLCGEKDCPCETAWGLVRCDGTTKPAYEAVKKVFLGE